MQVQTVAPDRGEEEFSEHGVQRRLGGHWLTILNGLALAFSTYQLIVAAFHPLSSLVIRSLHVGFLLCITFILYPAFKSGGRLSKVGAGDTALAEAVARNYFKLLAYKDEYEVARLFVAPEFQESLAASFEGDYRVNFHMTLPWSRGARPGEEPKKIRFGPWLLPAMKLLARFKFLRGTAFNPFGPIAERRQERELIDDYEHTVAHILDKLDHSRLDAAVALASIPEMIRGYGPVKERSILQARAKQKELMADFDRPAVATTRELHTA